MVLTGASQFVQKRQEMLELLGKKLWRADSGAQCPKTIKGDHYSLLKSELSEGTLSRSPQSRAVTLDTANTRLCVLGPVPSRETREGGTVSPDLASNVQPEANHDKLEKPKDGPVRQPAWVPQTVHVVHRSGSCHRARKGKTLGLVAYTSNCRT